MVYPTKPIYKIARDTRMLSNPSEAEDGLILTKDGVEYYIPPDTGNRHYQMYLEDIKTHGMSIVSCDDCGNGLPNDSMWQYLNNAEQLIHDKYHSDPSLHDKITALREHKYVKAMKSEFPYENMKEADMETEKIPGYLKIFMDKFIDKLKDKKLTRNKQKSILYKVVKGLGVTPQELMMYVQKVKKGL